MPLLNAIVMIICTYFCLQSFYIILLKWTTLNFTDKVTALETMNLAMIAFFEAFEIIFIDRYDGFLGGIFRGRLFGFREGLINKNATHAFFRSRKYLKNPVNCVYDVRELHEVGEDRRGDEWEQDGGENEGTSIDYNRGDEKIKKDDSTNLFSNKTDNELEIDYGENRKMNQKERKMQKYDSKNNSSIKTDKHTQVDSKSNNENFEAPFGEHHSENKSKCSEFEDNLSNLINVTEFTEFEIYNQKKDSELLVESLCVIEELSKETAVKVVYATHLIEVLCFCLSLVPFFSLINYYVRDSNIDNLKSSFMIYVPFTNSSTHENIEQFIAITLVQCVYLYLFFKLMVDILTMATLSYGVMKTEITLFLNRLSDFDERFCGKGMKLFFKDERSREEYQLLLRRRLNKIIAQHQTILRMVRQYSDMISYSSIYSNGIICLELCVSIFLLQGGDPSLKFKYGLFCVSLVGVVAHYCEDGQMIEDKMGVMRDSLYEISWHNLPISQQKSLLIQLTRSTKPPTIGPLGIFTINRMNFSSIIRASYSYFSVLNQIK